MNIRNVIIFILCLIFLCIGYAIAHFDFNKTANEFCKDRETIKSSRELEDTQQTHYIYEVKKGDTLASISMKFNSTVEAIMGANAFTSQSVTEGTAILIPR